MSRNSKLPVNATIERLAIIIREDAYDRVLTPLIFAFLEADDIVDPGWFLREKCLAADHCQYF